MSREYRRRCRRCSTKFSNRRGRRRPSVEFLIEVQDAPISKKFGFGASALHNDEELYPSADDDNREMAKFFNKSWMNLFTRKNIFQFSTHYKF